MVIPPIIPVVSETAASAPKKATLRSDPKAECEARGWIWDEATKSCNNPDVKPLPKTPTTNKTLETKPGITSKNVSPEEYEAYRQSLGFGATDKSQFGTLKDVETGRLSGFEQGGKTYLGVSPEEAKGAVETEAQKQELQIGGQAEQVLTQRQQELQSQGLDLSAQVGQDPLTELQNQFTAQEVSYVGALASAVPGVIPDLATGFATGGS